MTCRRKKLKRKFVKKLEKWGKERSPVEDGPGADGEDEEFEREGNEKTIAFNLNEFE